MILFVLLIFSPLFNITKVLKLKTKIPNNVKLYLENFIYMS